MDRRGRGMMVVLYNEYSVLWISDTFVRGQFFFLCSRICSNLQRLDVSIFGQDSTTTGVARLCLNTDISNPYIWLTVEKCPCIIHLWCHVEWSQGGHFIHFAHFWASSGRHLAQNQLLLSNYFAIISTTTLSLRPLTVACNSQNIAPYLCFFSWFLMLVFPILCKLLCSHSNADT